MVRTACPQPRRLADRSGRRRALVSLTPLIDVVFILLVFFMLASSFLDWRAIDLSTPAGTSAGAAMEGALLVEVLPARLRLSGEVLSIETLATRVTAQLRERPDRRVLVRPAEGVALQRVVQILDRLAAVGATDVSLIRAR
ncbi:biopolymer transporter ExbD [Pelagibius sp.]|uniref:ExbD/TolR family protein n=1 Tax=Pelagibius sp. TaxID=1931238 RepID=UPI002618E667|nr:biopolymer transporter ExbD [Pelagibius sp.]